MSEDDPAFTRTAEELALLGGTSPEDAARMLRDVLGGMPLADRDGPPFSVWGPGDWLKPPLYMPMERSYGTHVSPTWRFRPEYTYGTYVSPIWLPMSPNMDPWEPPEPVPGTVFDRGSLRAAQAVSERLCGRQPLTEEFHRIQRGVRYEMRGLAVPVLPEPLLAGCFHPRNPPPKPPRRARLRHQHESRRPVV